MAMVQQLRKSSTSFLLRQSLNIPSRLPSGLILRDYQEDAVKSVLLAADRGITRSAVVLATGGGKTVVMSSLIPQLKPLEASRRKTLVLAHKEELVKQATATIAKINPDLNVQIDMLTRKPDSSADIVVGSVPTLVRMSRLERYNSLEFKLIVLDECHHATAGSWMKILNYFGALEPDLSIHVVGFTATMERADGDSLGRVFQEIVYERSLLTMVENKELCDVKFSTMKVDMNLEDVPVRYGDYLSSKLSGAVNRDSINLQVAKAYLQLQKEFNFRSTIVFCVDIDHCKTLCGVLQENGVNAQYVTGNTVRHERQAILQDFKEGKIQVLCNVLVFTEGTDIPNIDSMILARPTKSRPLLIQMIGRGLRLHQDKDYCHVIDMVGTGKLGVLSVPTLFGLSSGEMLKNKTLLELEREVLELDMLKEQIEANKRQQEVKQILEIQQQLQGIDLHFNTIDGFASFESANIDQFKNASLVNKQFKDSKLPWVRLEYDVWGAQIPHSSTYYVIERNTSEEDDKVQFSLTRKEAVPRSVIIASKFKSARTREFKLENGTLPYVLSMAENLLGAGRMFLTSNTKPITAKQRESLVRGLNSKVKQIYGDEALSQLDTHISELNSSRASSLIFAMKYSVNSLWVRWELSKMYGPPPTLQARAKRKKKNLQQQLDKLNSLPKSKKF